MKNGSFAYPRFIALALSLTLLMLGQTTSASFKSAQNFAKQTAPTASPITWSSRGPGGGGALFAPSLSPHNTNEIYIACDMSEVFHTTNLGASWSQEDFREIQGSRQSQVRFTSNSLIRYAIDYTGDLATPTRSTDGGATWTQLASDPTGNEAYALYVDDSSTSRILVSDYSNIYFSSNGGSTFTQKFSTASGSGCFVAGAFFDGTNIYVGTNLGLLVSTNNGATFALSSVGGISATQAMTSFAGAKQGATTRLFCVTGTPGDIYPGHLTEEIYFGYQSIYALDWGQANWTAKTTGIVAGDMPVFVSMSRGDISTAYVAGQASNEFPIIYKTTNGGTSWQSVLLTNNNQNIFTGWAGRGGDRDWSYGAGALGFAVSPIDPNRVVFTDLGFAHLTTDGGATWKQMYVNSADQNPMGALTPKGRPYHSIGLEDTTCWWLTWSDATNMFASYSDIKGTRSTDGGAAWSFNFTGQNYNSTYQSVKHPTTATLYVATASVHDLYQSTRLQDSILDAGTGEVLFSTNQGAVWQRLHDFQNPVIGLAIDPNNTNRMYASVIDSSQGGIFVSSNIQNGSASTWTKLTTPPRTEGHPFNIKVLNDGTLVCTYSGRRNSSGTFTQSSGVFYSTNGGSSWLDRSHSGMIYWTKDLVVDANDATQSTWYVGVFSGWGGPPNGLGGLYKTTNRGVSWTRISALDRVTSCTINPTNANEMYVTTETEGLWITTNLNAATPTFSPVLNYPFRQPERVFFNPFNPNEIWVTSFGNGLKVGSTCGYAISANGGFFGPSGGEGSVVLTCANSCNWTVTNENSWIALTSAESGTGSEIISFSVRENFTGSPRQGTISIAGQTYTVIQNAGLEDCTYVITPTSGSFPAGGANGTITIITAEHCAWQAVRNVDWITFTSSEMGIGSGSVSYAVTANTTGSARKGRITIGSQVFTVKQK